MALTSAVLLLGSEESMPLMLRNVMGTPLLAYLATALSERGVERFFVACRGEHREMVKACFSEDTRLTIGCDNEIYDRLNLFLSAGSENEREVLLMTGPAMLAPPSFAPDYGHAPTSSPIFTVRRRAMMNALATKTTLRTLLKEQGKPCTDRDGWYAISSAEELADWQSALNRDTLARLVRNGVEVWDYHNCYVDPDVKVGKGTVLLPGTILRHGTVIGENCTIGPNTMMKNTKVADGAVVNSAQLESAVVGMGANVGPFAYVRPDTVIGDGCKVGDFVELKNTKLGAGTKVPHLTYVGDSDVGERTNFGCGCVTCNYDRAEKHRTVVGNDCFIGCNTNLVAPVTVADGAYTAAGSTVTEDVPADALAIARARQTNIPGWAKTNKVKVKK